MGCPIIFARTAMLDS